MSTSIESISETMIMLMKSTGIYVYKRIQGQVYKDIYVDTLKKCMVAVERNTRDYERFKADIEAIADSFDLNYKSTFFNKRRQEREYYNMACTHALDIITKLNARFNTGASDSEPRGYRNKGWFIPADTNIFD